MPLGNGFPRNKVQHPIIVAGGIGQTPFLTYCQDRQERVSLLYGARTASRIACMDDFRQLGIEPIIATDDGSEGHHGLVTDLIEKVYESGESTQLLCCGPLPMLNTAFATARRLGVPCFVSLETPMSCGLGICFGCVVPYWNDESSDWDYRRTCIDGPVFDAYKLRWDEQERQLTSCATVKELVVEADIKSFNKVLDFVYEKLERTPCSSELLGNIILAVEEVFVNIANYAYQPSSGSVLLSIDAGDEAVIRFEDTGKPYNPLDHPEPDVDKPLMERDIGGLGIFLVKTIMDKIDYMRVDDKNVLVMTKKLSVPAS
jgi:dihydroorotate dehydrogenase electron transfer subunit